MNIVADLHIHSKYSRATSNLMDLENLSRFAKIKGIDVLGTGDFTHPLWFKELKHKLSGDGIYEYDGMKFILSAEISLMYTQNGRGRRVHNIILAPDFGIAGQVNEWLGKKGRLDYDGRPIFNFNCIELVDAMMNISKDIEIIPAHAFTPWFSLFGSMSGFDSIDECFGDRVNKIHAIETGLSSNPAMNWRLSQLDRFSIVSFSDSHSPYPWRLGREATVFDVEKISCKEIINAIRNKKIVYTIEFFPEEGKYHYDGHRACGVCMSPKEALKNKNICPKCRRMLTIGVLHRVEELADRPDGYKPEGAAPFKSLIPLSEIIAAVTGSGTGTQKVWGIYNRLIQKCGSEFKVLLEAEKSEIKAVSDETMAETIIANREGKIKIEPGYDGVYGKPVLQNKQKTIGEFMR
ncbi:MAG: DNA helicase UvrD [Candidatus Aenigmarchaeota archaeon]|nr:DNA helicase UvrD [Candidatus Aenigmarchaeota archaeon]